MTIKLYLGDCLEILPTLAAETFALAFVDPPYNIGVFTKMQPTDYLAWCREWVAEVSRVLKPNGSFWVSHKDPTVLTDISRMIAKHGRQRINWITWDKYNGNPTIQATGGPMMGMTMCAGLRSFQVMAEYLIYHADEGDWTRQCDQERGFIFEPLRAYLDEEWTRAGLKRAEANIACNTASMAARHFFSRSQWCLPTEPHYQALRDYANRHNHSGEYLRREYEDLRREYEDLRREYEDLRYTFNNPGKMSSVWQIPPASANGHPTPKPVTLLERIILATTNPGDLVLDPMCGSGTTGEVCVNTGRDCVLIEKLPKYHQMTKKRIAAVEIVQETFA